jgi:hypothetical protein
LRRFAKEDQQEKELAFFCLEQVKRNGGILEHPAGSSFFKAAGLSSSIYSIDQSWFGFPARKTTWLYFNGYKPEAFPVMGFVTHKVSDMWPPSRSKQTLNFCHWLIRCIDSGTPQG